MDTFGSGLPEPIAESAVLSPSGAAAIDALLDDRAALKKLVQYCLWHLGWDASYEDAEDALQEFCTRYRQRVIDTYKPGAQSLITYFKLCLSRYCWKKGKQLRRQAQDADSLAVDLQVIDDNKIGSPLERILAGRDDRKREDLEGRLSEAISHLPPDQQQLLKLRYEENQSIRQIAAELGISESAAKVRLFRARDRVAVYLKRVNDAQT